MNGLLLCILKCKVWDSHCEYSQAADLKPIKNHGGKVYDKHILNERYI